GVVVRALSPLLGITTVVSWALTAAVPPGPVVPVAVAVLISGLEMVMLRRRENDWLAPGASGPQLPSVKSSPVFPGVPLSSTRVPAAAKKSPLLVTLKP